jgi:S-DNA-T family DNA segregation ATPase FtsK/SpoIIIE
MAKTIKKETDNKKTNDNGETNKGFKISKQHKILLGSLFVLFSLALLLSFCSFFIYGQQDQSAISEFADRNSKVENWIGKLGAYLSDLFVYRGFGIASFLYVRLFFLTGAYLILDLSIKKLRSTWFWDLFAIVVISILFGFATEFLPELGGVVGFEMNLYLQDFIGRAGTLLVLIFGLIIYLIYKIKVSPETIKGLFERTKKEIKDDLDQIKPQTTSNDGAYNLEEFAVEDIDEDLENIEIKPVSQFEINKESLKPTINNSSELHLEPSLKSPKLEIIHELEVTPQILEPIEEEFIIEKAPFYTLISGLKY